MNANDILDMVGDAKGTYVWDAQQIRSGAVSTKVRKLPVRKMWLIAAVIALTLLLAGCAVVYVLNLQGLIVGEHTPFAAATEADMTNNTEEENIALISLQNVHQPALAEWLEFKQNYDLDGTLMTANDNNESGIPEPYNLVYGCYTWDMVKKLDEITAKYDLQLLSHVVDLQPYAYKVLYDALNIESVVKEEAVAEVEYLDSYFYPGGTFDVSFLITMPNQEEELLVGLRYSLKDYFDPVVGSIGDVNRYDQWHYTQSDGIDLLLAVDAETGRMYADLPDAFVSVQTKAMTKDKLEQLVEVFNLQIRPESASMDYINTLLKEAEILHEEQKAKELESLHGNGYSNYIKQLIMTYSDWPLGTENMTYALYDINGDGMEELIVCGFGNALVSIESAKNGESFHYFDADNLAAFRINICKDNIIEIFDSYEADGVLYEFNHFYFHADIEGVSFITGLYKDPDGRWHQYLEYPEPDPRTHKLKEITDEEAQSIMASYEPLNLDMKPIADYPFE